MNEGRQTEGERVEDVKTRRVNLSISLKLEMQTSEKDGLGVGSSKNNKPRWDLFDCVPPGCGQTQINVFLSQPKHTNNVKSNPYIILI